QGDLQQTHEAPKSGPSSRLPKTLEGLVHGLHPGPGHQCLLERGLRSTNRDTSDRISGKLGQRQRTSELAVYCMRSSKQVRSLPGKRWVADSLPDVQCSLKLRGGDLCLARAKRNFTIHGVEPACILSRPSAVRLR